MLSLKSILTESPDTISIPEMHGGSADDLIEFQEARYTFLIYPDLKDGVASWVAYDYREDRLISSNEGLVDDVYGKKDLPLFKNDVVGHELDVIGQFPAHYNIRKILSATGRFSIQPDRAILDGRLYEHEGKWYFPFWQPDLSVLLKKHKSLIDDFLKTIKVDHSKVFFEDENDERVYYTYDEVFGPNETPQPSSSDEQRRMKQMKQDLHLNKAVLDKAIVRALQSKPKDVNSLYQRLEKQFDMPIAKIKHLYGAIPLDKLIVKKAKELNESFNKTINPADRWVGVVKHDGSVILPPNQNGDSQHYHYGLDGHQYRFSYWPHKKEISWWNFPTEEEDLSVKVEDYLIRKGYPVDRHVDYTGKKIRDVLSESMFPKDFNRHSLGSCMAAAALATDYLLSKGRSDFKVVEGMVSLFSGQEYRDWSPHTWIQFNNGKVFDPTRKQWAQWGFNPNEVKFKKVTRTYTPEEYQSVCQRQPDDLSKFKKMAESFISGDEFPEKLYHATYRPLLDEILHYGLIPGGKDIQNFDWSNKFVYLAEEPENAISFVETSENENIPEEWLEQIVVIEIDVSKLDLSKMSPDENWNPSTGEGETGYHSFQYNGVIPPDALRAME